MDEGAAYVVEHKGYVGLDGAGHNVLGGALGADREGLKHGTFASSPTQGGRDLLVREA